MAISQVDPGMAPYQILDAQGKLVGKMPDMSAERLLSLYRYMQLGRAFSNKIVALQRQGRATTFGSLVGQEATAVGLAAPLQAQDWLTTSYREIASLVVRGMPLATLVYSFTLNNVGSFGGSSGTPIINAPEVAILAVGRLQEKAIVEQGAIVARPMMPLALSFDHRLIDGALAGRFLAYFKELVENPQQLLLDMQ